MIKVFSAFSGYGGFEWGLIKANIQYECIGISEIDKYAIQCYNQNFPNIKNYGDITKIDEKELPDFDLFVGGFPCQSFSIAGKRKGFEDTRGTLIFDVLRICKYKQPKWIVLENVKGLVNHDKGNTLKVILDSLKEIGYQVMWKVLNTKKFGIPQNRERIFIVCFRNDIYKPLEFQFPNEEPLKLLLKDVLDKEVDKKYYLNSQTVKRLLNYEKGFRSKINSEIGSCLFSSQYKVSRGIDLINTNKSNYEKSNIVYDINCIPPTLTKVSGGNQEKKIIFNSYNGKCSSVESGTIGTSTGTSTGKSCALRTYPRNSNPTEEEKQVRFKNLEIRKDNLSNSITTHTNDSLINDGYIIRKLTPKECFRLQGFLNDEINLDGLSDTQKYRLAGNGVSINVTEKIFRKLFK
ncbi:MAG TPA: DNA (cytosine-5-)-methyltransferase [Caldisericia bacterium]|nr:DNA (cytosine-5-)-methyltransferase [Caldisericia bacterium]